MFKEVFISYAREDYKVAEEIYESLVQQRYSPWLDKKKLKVGANWDYEIQKALKKSTFVILLLSSTSVSKRGYVQREFRRAIEYSETKLIDDIYIIPILLDKCEVPESLGKFQWIEIENDRLMDEIIDSLNYQRKKLLESTSKNIIEINDYTSFSIDFNIDFPNTIDYKCDLPLFYQNKFFDYQFVNTFIQQKALKIISQYRHFIIEDKEHLINIGYPDYDFNFYFEISHTVKNLNEKFLSLTIFYNSYLGGAHPNMHIDTLNFAFNPERILELRYLVEYNNINEFIKECLFKYGSEEQKENLKYYLEYLDENIDFVFDDKTLEIDITNHIPHVILPLGIIKIPMKDLDIKWTIK